MQNILKKKGVSHTVLAVLTFLIGFVAAVYSESARSEGYIGLGKSTFNSHSMMGEVGYRTDSNWDYQLMIIGEGETKRGRQNTVYGASVSHVVKPGWKVKDADFFMRLGVAYIHDSPLVGDTNFRLGFGFDLGPFEVEMMHYSSADIHKTNTGVDSIAFRAKF
jgi:hypothetical protein